MITIVFKLLIYVGLYQITNAFSINSLPEATMTTLEIVAYYEYPSEIHTVTTDDGYILELHRIPGGKAENRTGNASKFVVFLQHGFVSSSAVWVTNLPNQSAAFIFADAGFDVWMGNVRGNTYSTKHVNYTQNDLKYWDFTFDEFAKYDLDSMINYVLNQTRQHSLYYIGYSEGTLTMFAKLSIDQIFAQKIRKFFALGPISTMAYIKGLIKTAATKFFRPLKMLIKISGNFMASKSLFQKISKSTCSLKSIVEHCENLMFQMIGPPNVRMNVSRIPVYMSHIPAGTSTANVLHWAQMVNSRKIQMYDYGSEKENMMHYNMSTPPLYNLSLINVPVYLYWSENDWIADKRDIQAISFDLLLLIKNSRIALYPSIDISFTMFNDGLLAKIPRKYLIQNNELQNFNHFDFVWSIHAADQIYKPIIEVIRNDKIKI